MPAPVRKLPGKLQEKWRRFMNLPRGEHVPGFIAFFPYLLILRILVVFGALYRFWYHDRAAFDTPWPYLATVTLLILAFVSSLSRFRNNRWLQGSMVVIDILSITGLYILTRTLESDFFLFYYVPIFSAAEYLKSRSLFWIIPACTLALKIGT
jgi:hypothetical protein